MVFHLGLTLSPRSSTAQGGSSTGLGGGLRGQKLPSAPRPPSPAAPPGCPASRQRTAPNPTQPSTGHGACPQPTHQPTDHGTGLPSWSPASHPTRGNGQSLSRCRPAHPSVPSVARTGSHRSANCRPLRSPPAPTHGRGPWPGLSDCSVPRACPSRHVPPAPPDAPPPGSTAGLHRTPQQPTSPAPAPRAGGVGGGAHTPNTLPQHPNTTHHLVPNTTHHQNRDHQTDSPMPEKTRPTPFATPPHQPPAHAAPPHPPQPTTPTSVGGWVGCRVLRWSRGLLPAVIWGSRVRAYLGCLRVLVRRCRCWCRGCA